MSSSAGFSDPWPPALADAASRYHAFTARWHALARSGWRLGDHLPEGFTRGLAVFGLGSLGRIAVHELDLSGIRPVRIVDNQPQLAGGRYRDIPVLETHLLWCRPEVEHLLITAIFAVEEIRRAVRYYRPDLEPVSLADLVPERG